MLPRANPAVVFQRLEEGAVLFSPSTEVYFGLNDVGVLIWEHLPPRLETFDALVAAIQERYPDVSTAVIREDAEELLAHLRAEQLVFDADPSATDAVASR